MGRMCTFVEKEMAWQRAFFRLFDQPLITNGDFYVSTSIGYLFTRPTGTFYIYFMDEKSFYCILVSVGIQSWLSMYETQPQNNWSLIAHIERVVAQLYMTAGRSNKSQGLKITSIPFSVMFTSTIKQRNQQKSISQRATGQGRGREGEKSIDMITIEHVNTWRGIRQICACALFSQSPTRFLSTYVNWMSDLSPRTMIPPFQTRQQLTPQPQRTKLYQPNSPNKSLPLKIFLHPAVVISSDQWRRCALLLKVVVIVCTVRATNS